ncbi:LOW QUALITY PROTEIN: ABC-type multidrug/protein/lipid transport system, ATPase component [Geomicrobium sp. JCM 19055]|nr:LOW QUALITY PROTEIN: ABC-type multidrug/protein/lipid transport system, ATPase component [Geomicrobium sp. JCM 19055]
MKNMIETHSLTKTVKSITLVKDIDFAIGKGEICGFIGPNGAGKTTVMRMLTGLIKPSKGTVKINGFDINVDRRQALKGIGAIVESPVFFEYMTGRKMLLNLARLHDLTGTQKTKKVEEVLNIVGLEGRGNDKIKNYSLGMKQRLGIAQALLGNPEIIILDEPANGLDPIGMRQLRELIIELNMDNQITFLISSHLLDEIQKICSDLIIIKDGKILMKGKKEDIYNAENNDLEELFF